MFIAETYKTSRGEVRFGFTAHNETIPVKVLSATLLAAPTHLQRIENVMLTHLHTLPALEHTYYDDFAFMVRDAVKQINWKQIEKRLYEQYQEALRQDLEAERVLLSKQKERVARLSAALTEADSVAKQGLLRKALSYIQSVIFSLT